VSRSPDKELAVKFGVSQITVRTAPANLEAESLISKMRGKGTFVTKNVPLTKQVIVRGDLKSFVDDLRKDRVKSLGIETTIRTRFPITERSSLA
jgi:DNA-binding GntR family transcriptional regulator